MSDAKTEDEPTMEEILASIRRIISDEDAPQSEGEAPTAEAPAEAGAGATLELTSVVNDDGSVTEIDEADEPAALEIVEPEPEPEPAPEPESAPEPEPEPAPEMELVSEAEPDPAPGPVAEPPQLDALSAIVSDPTANLAAGSLSDLAGAVVGARGVRIGSGATTLEELVKELIRPMLKQWLDENLPSLTQRLVEREINRISGRADED